MNILYIGPLFPHPGGTGISCLLLLRELTRLGHSVHAVSGITREAEAQASRYESWFSAIRVSRFPLPHFEVDPASAPASRPYWEDERRHIVEECRRITRHWKPDLVLGGREAVACLAQAQARDLRVPWVTRLGGPLLSGLVAGSASAHEDVLECVRAADLVLAQSEHMRLLVERLGDLRVEIVPNLVDLTQFSPRPKPEGLCRALGLTGSEIVVLHASNMKTVKRAGDIVRAAPAALSEEPRLRFVMVGDGPGRPALEETCRTLDVSHRFRFTGWVDYPQMPDYLALADIVVMPSAFEQQARLYLEAQASGRLLVASDIPGVRDVAQHGCTGLLYPVADVEALAQTLLVAARDPDLRERIGRAARRRVEAHSLPVVARMAETLLVDLLARGRG